MHVVTEDEAAAAVVAHPESDAGGTWEVAVTRVEDAGPAWRVFYNSKASVESGDWRQALGGNWPYLVVKTNGAVLLDREYRNNVLGL